MEPIDRPFRFSWDFCIVWLVLVLPTYLMTRSWEADEPVWSHCIFVFLLSMFAAFFIYGPVLLVRQIIRSGSRGWFVARVAVTVVLSSALVFFGYDFLGHGKDIPPTWIIAVVLAGSLYLHWRTDRREI